MKTTRFLAVVTLLLGAFVQYTSGQSCETYFPYKEGTVIEMTQYDAKDKVTGTSRQTVISKSQTAAGFEARIKLESNGTKKDETFESEYTVRCEQGVLKVELNQYISQEMLGSLEGMELEISGDEIEIPHSLSVGQTLDDGEIIMKVMNQGMAMMTMAVKVSNRKVDGRETITTPAGTFDCFKLSYDVETKMMMKISSKGEEWIADGYGMVKSATYNKTGKLTGYTLVTGIRKP